MKVLLNSIHLNGHSLVFHSQKLEPHLNKQYNMKVLLNSIHLNGHSLVFHSQKLEPHLNKQYHMKVQCYSGTLDISNFTRTRFVSLSSVEPFRDSTILCFLIGLYTENLYLLPVSLTCI